MVEQTINIPTEFIQSMKEFMDKMKQFTASPKLVEPQLAVVSPAPMIGQFRRMSELFSRFDTTINRSLDLMLNDLGPTARLFIRSLPIERLLAADVSGALQFVGRYSGLSRFGAIGLVIGTAQAAFDVVKWLWTSVAKFGEAMQTDQRQALMARTSIGGLRALRIGLSGVLSEEELASYEYNVALASADMNSRQFMVVHNILSIMRRADNLQTMLQGLLIAQRFMQAQPEQFQLPIARARGLAEIIPSQVLLRLRRMPRGEMEAWAAWILANQKNLTPTPEARKNLIAFFQENENLAQSIQNTLGQKLADSGLLDALIRLSKSFAIFIDKFSKSQVAADMTKAIEHGMDNLSAAAKEASQQMYEAKRAIERAYKEATQFVRIVDEQLRKLQNITDNMLVSPARGEIAAALPVSGPAAIPITGRVGPTFRPGVGPGARAAPAPAPGPGPFVSNVPRAPTIPGKPGIVPRGAPLGPMPKGGIRRYTGPGAPRIHEAPPTAQSPSTKPRFQAPISPEKAPETVKEAISGGFVGGAGTINRAEFAAELRDNPELRERVLQIAANEQGTNPQGTQAVIESMMNRAQVRGHTLAQEARWTSEGGYYDDRHGGRGRAISTAANPSSRPVLENSLNNALNGSNISNYAYGNASGGTAASKLNPNNRAGAEYRSDFGGETFFGPNRDEPLYTQKYNEWLRQQQQQPSGDLSHYTVEDINRGIGTLPKQIPTPAPPGGGYGGGASAAQINADSKGNVPPGGGLRQPVSASVKEQRGSSGPYGDPRIGARAYGAHAGADLTVPRGTPVYAAVDGTITQNEAHGSMTPDGPGLVTLHGDDGRNYIMMHMPHDPNLQVGQRVKAGDQIGVSGIGNGVPHVHYEIWSGARLKSQRLDAREVFQYNRGNPIVGGQPVDPSQAIATAPKSSAVGNIDYQSWLKGTEGQKATQAPGYGGGYIPSQTPQLLPTPKVSVPVKDQPFIDPSKPGTAQAPSTDPKSGAPPKVTGPGQWSELTPAPNATHWEPGPVDPRLREIMSSAGKDFEAANPGYRVYGRSGHRSGNDPHGRNHAMDVRIFDPNGKEIDPYTADKTGKYGELSRYALGEAQARYPELIKSKQFMWGGHFSKHGSGLADPVTGRGDPDMEHFDLEGDKPYRRGLPEKLYEKGPMPGVKYGRQPDNTSAKDSPHPPDPETKARQDLKKTADDQSDAAKDPSKAKKADDKPKPKVKASDSGPNSRHKEADADLGGSMDHGVVVHSHVNNADIKVIGQGGIGHA